MSQWTPIYLLPNVKLEVPIECEGITLTNHNDPRVFAARERAKNFDEFLRRFSSNFGERFIPAVLMVQDDEEKRPRDVEGLAGFRDAMTAGTVPLARSWAMTSKNNARLMFSDYLDFYPWNLDKNDEFLICDTPAALGLHEVSEFTGQSSPALFRQTLREIDLDQPVLGALLSRWRVWVRTAEKSWSDIALFRSLNMANAAARMPGERAFTLYDIGRQIGLWISAFEILVHPGPGGIANAKKVRKLLQSDAIALDFLKQQTLRHKDEPSELVSPVEFLYLELCRVRNAFFHGNPVSQGDLILRETRKSIYNFAAPLYRVALTAFLGVELKEAAPDSKDDAAVETWATKSSQHTMTRFTIEAALRAAFSK